MTEEYKLTLPQKNIMGMEIFFEGTNVNNITAQMDFSEALNPEQMENVINQALEANETLRLCVKQREDDIEQVRQYIREFVPISVPVHHFKDEKDEEYLKWREEYIGKPVDIYQVLYDFQTILFQDYSGKVFVKVHHLISDAWAQITFCDMLFANYKAAYTGGELKNCVSYKGYMEAEQSYLHSERFKKDEEYWCEKMAQPFDIVSLRRNLESGVQESRRLSITLSDHEMDVLKGVMTRNNGTIFNVMLSALGIYTARSQGSRRFLIGTPLLNRKNKTEKKSLGVFMNTVPLLLDFEDGKTFAQVCKDVSAEIMGGFRHQQYPVSYIRKLAQKEKNHNEELFHLFLSYQSANLQNGSGEWCFNAVEQQQLAIHVSDYFETENFRIDYDYFVKLFTQEEIYHLHRSLFAILEDALAYPEKGYEELNILGEQEKTVLLENYNDTRVYLSKADHVVAMMKKHASAVPERTAVETDTGRLTYKELDENSDRIAAGLRERGVEKGDLVAIRMKRCEGLLPVMFGILKCGAAYLPIDPDYPKERVRYILEDSKARCAVSQHQQEGQDVYLYEELIKAEPQEPIDTHINPQSLCYMIYTSGSTGNPKGVMLTHKNVANYCKEAPCNVMGRIIRKKDTRILSVTTISFDIFVTESLLAAANGLTIVLAKEEQANNGRKLNNFLKCHPADMIQTTPSKLSVLLNDLKEPEILRMRTIMLGGEPIDPTLVEEILEKNPGIEIYNVYGPTETTVWSSIAGPLKKQGVSIGTPVANTQIYILDPRGQIQPIGALGEICIAGKGVSRGYFKRNALTKERFTKNPYGQGKLYHTGDFGFWNIQGELEFSGREDGQIKLHGLRIELGEIEHVISQYPGVGASAAAVRGKTGNPYLCGFFTAAKEVNVQRLRLFLEERLPYYMVPAILTQIKEMPYTNNGKIDRKALPEAEYKETILPCTTKNQKRILKVIYKVIEGQKLGKNTDLYSVGMTSLSAIRIASYLEQEFQVEISVKDILKYRTISLLEEYLKTRPKRKSHEFEKQIYYPLSDSQLGIYLEYIKNPRALNYNIPILYKFSEEIQIQKLKSALTAAIDLHPYLKTRVEELEEGPVLVRQDETTVDIPVREWGQDTRETLIRPMNLREGPLYRIELYQNPGEVYLFLDIHHLIFDGASAMLLLECVRDIYEGREPEKENYTGFEYLLEEQERKKQGSTEKSRSFMLQTFKGKEESIWKHGTGESAAYVSCPLGKAWHKRAEDFAAKHKITPNILLLSAFYYVVGKYTGRTDALIGTVEDGRNRVDFSRSMGMMVKTVPLYASWQTREKILAFLNRSQTEFLEFLEADDYPYTAFTEETGLRPELLFVYQNHDFGRIKIGKETADTIALPLKNTKFTLSFNVNKEDIRIEYKEELFSEKEIMTFAQRVLLCAEFWMEHPQGVLGDTEYFSEEDKRNIQKWNETKVDVDMPAGIWELFQEQVRKNPHRPAVIDREGRITYRELDIEAAKLAGWLFKQGAKTGRTVAVSMPRDRRAVTAMLAVMKTGGVYLPVDREWPAERKQYVLEDSHALFCIDEDMYEAGIRQGEYLEKGILPGLEQPCYMIYTSGSTGKPKGAVLLQKGAVNFSLPVGGNILTKEIAENCTRELCMGNFAFDISLSEIFPALFNGKTLVLADSQTLEDPFALAEFMIREQADAIQGTPSRLLQYMETPDFCKALAGCRLILVAAEAFPWELAKRLRDDTKAVIMNGYGPSETTIGCSYSYVNQEPVTIGRPIANTSLWVVDKDEKPLPWGIKGELMVEGVCVGAGYVGNPTLTQEKFKRLAGWGKRRVYATGDLAEWNQEGELLFHGRSDHLVKLRGLRIELGEIEEAIKRFQGIRQSAVKIIGEGERAYICAYCTMETGRTMSSELLEHFLEERLPAYMLPSEFILLERMPMTTSGKVDYQNLPRPVAQAMVPPENPCQKKIYELAAQVLHTEAFGIDTDLRRMGLNSLLAVRLNGLLQKEFQVKIGTGRILKNASVSAIEQIVNQSERTGKAVRTKRASYPLMDNQMGIYLDVIKNPETTTYNIPVLYRFAKGIDRKRLCSAVIESVKIHDSMCCHIEEQNGLPMLLPGTAENIRIFRKQWENQESWKEEIRPFDLHTGPLFRFVIFEDGEETLLLCDVHHLIFDGESLMLFMEDVKKIYEGEEAEPESYTAFDYALEREAYKEGKGYREDEAFFRHLLSDGVSSSLRTERTGKKACAAYEECELTRQEYKTLEEAVRDTPLNISSMFLGAYLAVLSRFLRQEELLIGTVADTREDAQERFVGMLVQTLPYKFSISGEETILSYLGRVQSQLYQIMEHSGYSYMEMAAQYRLNLEILYIYQNYQEGSFRLGETQGQMVPVPVQEDQMAKFPVSLNVAGRLLRLEYDASLYSEAMMKSILASVKHTVLVMAKKTGKKIRELSIVDASQKKLLAAFNDTKAPFDPALTLVLAWEEQVRLHRKEPAVYACDGTDTYEELNRHANGIAQELVRRGIKKGQIVALRLRRTRLLMRVILGIMKAGAAYLPIDQSAPDDRVEYMLRDSGAVLLIQDGLAAELDGNPLEENLSVPISGEDLCYIIYTSGSTGRPKGVMTRHRNLLNYALPLAHSPQILTIRDKCRVSLAVGSIAFDIAVAEIYPFLLTGKAVILADENQVHNVQELKRLIERYHADAILCTPSRMLQYMEDEAFTRLLSRFHSISAAGEAVPVRWLEKLRKATDADLFNGYGPTETTAGSAFQKMEGEKITIGKPLSNEQVHILDQYGTECPIKAAGELCISGDGVAKGYLYREELTKEKFTPNPFGEGTMYHTGDLAQWDEKGEIEFLGRLDNQVKFHGYRMELGEIEDVMNRYPHVKESVAVVRKQGDRQILAGYFVADKKTDIEDLTRFMKSFLPEYMIPSAFMQVESFKLNMNAKIDRQHLPEIQVKDTRIIEHPRTKTERLLCEIISECLNLKEVGRGEHFFHLGGDSILSIQVVSRCAAKGISITPKDLLKHPVISDLAESIDNRTEHREHTEQGVLTGEVLLSPIQKWIHRKNLACPDHFNQSVLLRAETINSLAAEEALKAVVLQQDVLRLQFDGKRQSYGEKACYYFRDFGETEDIDTPQRTVQLGLSLEKGILAGAGVFTCKGEAYLFFAIHHWAVDAVSWRIFISQFALSYENIRNGRKQEFPRKTGSFRSYMEALSKWAEALPKTRTAYWKEAVEQEEWAVVKKREKPCRMKTAVRNCLELTREDTERLEKKICTHYGLKMQELLLLAIVKANKKITGKDALTIHMESHGRSSQEPFPDVSQTMGWFTSFYPVPLLVQEDKLYIMAENIRKQIRSIPDGGLSYGALAYGTGEEIPEMKYGISFNYLGRQNLAGVGENGFVMADKKSQMDISLENQMLDYFSVNGGIQEGRLILAVDYDPGNLYPEKAEALTAAIGQMLSAVIHEEEADRYYPILEGQKGIYLSSMLDEEDMSYHEACEYIMPMGIRGEKLAESFLAAIKAHPGVNAVFVRDGMDIRQRIQEGYVPEIVCRSCTEKQYQEEKNNFIQPFDMENGPLYRLGIYNTQGLVRVLFDIHHLIYDRSSAAVLMKAVETAYEGGTPKTEKLSCAAAALEEYGSRYTDQWQEARQFYGNRFADFEGKLFLPGDPQQGQASVQGTYRTRLNQQAEEAIRQICAKEGVTPNGVLLSAVLFCLSKYSGQNDVTIGTVSSGRSREAFNECVGMFVKTIPVRCRIEKHKGVREFIQNNYEELVNSMEQDSYGFHQLVEELGLSGKDGNPMFDFLYAYQNVGVHELSIDGQPIQEKELVKKDVKFDITCMAVPYKDTHEMVYEYNTKKYQEANLMGLTESISRCICEMELHLEDSLETLDICTETERKMLRGYQDGEQTEACTKFVPELFEETAEKLDGRTAVYFEDREITFKELNEMANRVANTLLKSGLDQKESVMLLLPRGPEYLACMLGIMKAGMPYLPMDISYPADRIRLLLGDTKTRNLITFKEQAENYKDMGRIFLIEDIGKEADTENPRGRSIGSEDIFCLLHTSGSTGKPKCSALTYGSVTNFVQCYTPYFEKAEKFLALTTVTFDAFLMDTVYPLANGKPVVLLNEEECLSQEKTEAAAVKHDNLYVFMTPTRILEQLKNFRTPGYFTHFSEVIIGGEVFQDEIYQRLSRLSPKTRIRNIYGPTETTIFVLSQEITGEKKTALGSPCPNSSIYLLDEEGKMLPAGAAGEIYIGGRCVGGGYYRNKELTQNSFHVNPWGEGRMYKTGDLGRYNVKGEIEFIGRRDHQVKFHGQRIELEEIQECMNTYPGIITSAVVKRGVGEREILCAYYTGAEAKEKELKEYLSQKLTYYMIPNQFIHLEEMPYTSSGKISKRELPEVQLTDEKLACETGLQKALQKIAAEILGEEPGRTNDFYRYGMTSLMAIRMNTEISQKLGYDISAREILANPTIERLEALMLKKGTHPAKKYGLQEDYPLTGNQYGLYLEYEKDREALNYNIPMLYRFEKDIDTEKLKDALVQVIEKHGYLNTRLYNKDGEIRQKRMTDTKIVIPVIPWDDGEILKIQELVQPFDLFAEPLYRIKIFRTQRYVYLFFDIHHIIFDGESAAIFMEDLKAVYEGRLLKEESYTGFDLSLWEKERNTEEKRNRDKEFYMDLLKDSDDGTLLAGDRNGTKELLGTYETELPQELEETIKAFSRKMGVTGNHVYLSAFMILLSHYARQEQVAVSTITSAREDAKFHRTMGMMVKTLPYACRVNGEETVKSFLSTTRERSLALMEHDSYPYYQMVSDMKITMNIMFAYQNHTEEPITLGNTKAEQVPLKLEKAKFPLSLDMTGRKMNFEYRADRYSREFIQGLSRAYLTCLASLAASENKKLRDLSVVSQEDWELIRKFNDRRAEYDREKSLVWYFEHIVDQYPDAPALVCGEETLTYRQLDEEANRAAHALISRGVGREDIVILHMSRTRKLICALWGILKAGAAFLPVDMDYPQERMEFVINDSQAKLMIVDEEAGYGREVTADSLFEETDISRPEVNISPEDACYVIYTSGSTGTPKGVVICHKNVTNYALPLKYNEFVSCIAEECTASLAICTVAFDIFCCEVFTIFLNGKLFVFADEDSVNHPALAGRLMKKYQVDIMQFTPSRLLQYMEDEEFLEALKGMKVMVVGAEVFPAALARRIGEYTDAKVFNAYGPTECTIGTTFIQVQAEHVTIGRPLSNGQVYIMDHQLQMLPAGAVGELCIAGYGVGRGYLNRALLNQEKYVKNPYGSGMLYRTGDLARWTKAGELEYAGRIDQQVKLNGLRIELGEIESRIMEYPGIRSCTVDVRDDGRQKFLCGYYTADEKIEEDKLKEYLAEKLVYYMVPKAWLQLDKLPVTRNGKVDKKQLPEVTFGGTGNYVKPQGEREELLCRVFGEVLDLSRAGALDNFFDLGGDSIKGIQVTSRMMKYGYRMQMRQLFQAPTPRALAPLLEKETAAADNAPVIGEAGLSPVQRYFFALPLQDKNQWNQSVLIKCSNKIDSESFRKALEALVIHHDILRAVYKKQGEEYRQIIRGITEKNLYGWHAVTEALSQEAIKNASMAMDLENGPLIQAVLIEGAKEDACFLGIHHLLVDGVSWRILLEDLETAYRDAVMGKEIHLPDKTMSYKEWVKAAEEYAFSPALSREISYWKQEDSRQVPGIDRIHPLSLSQRTMGAMKTVTFTLSEEETRNIQTKANLAYGTRTEELLLTAMLKALADRSGHYGARVLLEGHGRENITKNVNHSRTVGWFTATYPVVLEGKKALWEDMIPRIKEKLRGIPNNGIGYDILRYIRQPEEMDHPSADIQFNFLGEFEDQPAAEGIFQLDKFGCPWDITDSSPVDVPLQIAGAVMKKRLSINITCVWDEIGEAAVNSFSQGYQRALMELLEHCQGRERTYTASDFGWNTLTEEEFEKLKEESHIKPKDIQEIYPLSNLQRSMLVISQMYREEAYYHEQTLYEIKGTLDAAQIQENLSRLTEKYAVLRTSFVWKSLKTPYQIVRRQAQTDFFCSDISTMSEKGQETYLSSLMGMDRAQGFDAQKAPLFRLKLIKTGEAAYAVLASFSHIIMDKWSLDILLPQLLTGVGGENPPAYREYILWHSRQDPNEAGKYWKQILSSVQKPTKLGITKRKTREFQEGEAAVTFSPDLVKNMEGYCREINVTMSTLIQGIWAKLLMNRNHSEDVVWGYTLSGRPGELQGVDEMVGMFINTVPVRGKHEDGESTELFLKKLQKQSLETERYMYLPFGEIQKAAGLSHALFGHFLTYQNTPAQDPGTGAVRGLKGYNKSIHDFSVNIQHTPDGLQAVFRYNRLAYVESSIQGMLQEFEKIGKNFRELFD